MLMFMLCFVDFAVSLKRLANFNASKNRGTARKYYKTFKVVATGLMFCFWVTLFINHLRGGTKIMGDGAMMYILIGIVLQQSWVNITSRESDI